MNEELDRLYALDPNRYEAINYARQFGQSPYPSAAGPDRAQQVQNILRSLQPPQSPPGRAEQVQSILRGLQQPQQPMPGGYHHMMPMQSSPRLQDLLGG